MRKDEETDELIKIFVVSIKTIEKKLKVERWTFIFQNDPVKPLCKITSAYGAGSCKI